MRISCDADWGNVRHGKSLRLHEHKVILSTILREENISRLLDIGSSSGSLSSWLSEEFPEIRYVGVEPHEEQISLCAPKPNAIFINAYIEELSFKDGLFDFIYCSHTLEHADSARILLEKAYNLLDPNGILFLEVPSLAGVSDPHTVEEFFIDKHNYHFEYKTLVGLAKSIGFEIERSFSELPEALNISLLLRKGIKHQKQGIAYTQDSIYETKRKISVYGNQLSANRRLLKKVVDEKLIPLASRMKVAYWGAGRMFDALCKYGGLNSQHVFLLVDRHLHGLADSINNIPILPIEAIRIYEPQAVIVLARSSADQISKEAYRFGIRNVVPLYSLIEQVESSLSSEGQ